jgi:hypothetical protein
VYIHYLQHYTDAWVQYCGDTKLCRAVLHALRDYTQHMAQHSSTLDGRARDTSISKTTSAADIKIGMIHIYTNSSSSTSDEQLALNILRQYALLLVLRGELYAIECCADCNTSSLYTNRTMWCLWLFVLSRADRHVRKTLLRKAVAVLKYNVQAAKPRKSVTPQLSTTTSMGPHDTVVSSSSSDRHFSKYSKDYFGRPNVPRTTTSSTAASSVNANNSTVNKGGSYLAKHLLKHNTSAAQQ